MYVSLIELSYIFTISYVQPSAERFLDEMLKVLSMGEKAEG